MLTQDRKRSQTRNKTSRRIEGQIALFEVDVRHELVHEWHKRAVLNHNAVGILHRIGETNLQQPLGHFYHVNDFADHHARFETKHIVFSQSRLKTDEVFRIPFVGFKHVFRIVRLAIQHNAVGRFGLVAVVNAFELDDPTVFEGTGVLHHILFFAVFRVQHSTGSEPVFRFVRKDLHGDFAFEPLRTPDTTDPQQLGLLRVVRMHITHHARISPAHVHDVDAHLVVGQCLHHGANRICRASAASDDATDVFRVDAHANEFATRVLMGLHRNVVGKIDDVLNQMFHSLGEHDHSASAAGPETLRKALVNSHNTAAAQALMTLVGVDNSVAFLHAMGIDDAHIDATPFGLSLGSSGITPMQMAVAFGVLANGGVYQQPISVLGISDSTGKVIWDGHQQQERHRVFSESTAYMVVDMLKQAVSSGTGTNAKIKGQTVAGKTGTNSDQKGVFFAGMTGYYSSALWVGHDNYKALSSKSTGSRSAAPLWQSYMSKIHQGLSNRDILEGSASDYGLVKVTTCAVSGQLATDACRSDAMGYGVVTDYWKAGTEPTVSCQMHTTQTICSVSGLLASPYCPDTVTRGVLTIPSGHPLASFIGTEYEDVLIEYLGSYAVLGASGTCPYHTSASSSGSNTMVENTLIPDAKILLSQAYAQLQSMDIVNDAQRYSAIQSAITNLEYVISLPAPTTAEVASAMGQLTQAMAGLY